MKYHIITYGCQMNQSDSERIARILEQMGCQPAGSMQSADLVVINMCSVRQSAVDRVYGLFKKLTLKKQKNPNFKILLTGCILPIDRKKMAERVDLIVNIKDLPKLPKLLATPHAVKIVRSHYFNRIEKKPRPRKNEDWKSYLSVSPIYSSPYSAYIPIMTGCNNFCSYCVVPYARGREISRPADEILEEARNLIHPVRDSSMGYQYKKNLRRSRLCGSGSFKKEDLRQISNGVKKGYKKIVLLGQNVNSYSWDKINFPKLLKLINDIPGKFWLQFITSHPKDLSDELINTIAECEKITPYLHLPIQSGDNTILKRMNRHYTISHYKKLIRAIRKKIPQINISTDIIVGFPEETKKQFLNTARLMKEVKFDMAYIAEYSPREGTAAAKLKDNVDKKEKERRRIALTEILKKTALKNNKKYLGQIIEVLITGRDRKNYLQAETKTFKNVQILAEPAQGWSSSGRKKSPDSKIGEFVRVKITKAAPWGLAGIIIA